MKRLGVGPPNVDVSCSSQRIITATSPRRYAFDWKTSGRYVKSQLSAWVTVPSCVSLSRFGVTKMNWASVSFARSCVNALFGAGEHAVLGVLALQVRAAIGRSLAEQLPRVE